METPPPLDYSLFEIISSAGLVTYLVLIVLLLMSVVSWAIIFQKFLLFRKVSEENRRFQNLYYKVEDLVELRKAALRMAHSPIAGVFLAGLDRLDPSMSLKTEDDLKAVGEAERGATLKILERTLKRAIEDRIAEMEAYLSFLATTGNVSPFIGLFGTVLGIIGAFQGISRQGTASIAAVAPGVSEALLATAAGLLAAIPAVVAYNYFVSRVRVTAADMETFSAEFLSLVEERITRSASSSRAGIG